MADWILRGSIWMKQHYARVGIIAGFLQQLAKELIAQGDNERAKKVLAYAEQVIPGYNVPETHESGSYDIATAYAALGEKTKAVTLAVHLIAEAEDYINWAFH